MLLIDTHCHLDYQDYDSDRDEVLARAKEHGVGYIICIGATLTGSENSAKIADRYDNVFAAVGGHPHDAKDFDAASLSRIRELACMPKVVAIGEVGLDYYRNISPPEVQKVLFREFLRMAGELGKPVVIHSRQANEDMLAICDEMHLKKAMVHCFSGDKEFLGKCLDRGFYVSFTCNITYKKSDALRDVLAYVPADRLCLETDGPYLSPEGHRGKRNEPMFVRLLAEKVASLRGESLDAVASATTGNAVRFFNLPIDV